MTKNTTEGLHTGQLYGMKIMMATSNTTVETSKSTDNSFVVDPQYMHRFKYVEYLYEDPNGKWRVDLVYRLTKKQVRGGFVNELHLYLLKGENTRATEHCVVATIQDVNINMPEESFKKLKLQEFKRRAIKFLID